MKTSFAALALALLGVAGIGAVPARADDAARDAAIARGLSTRRLKDVKFEDARLADVLKWLRAATGWNFAPKYGVLKKAGVDLDAVTGSLELSDVSVGTILDLFLEPHGLVAKVESNVVFVTTKADSLGKPVFVLHPLSHITWRRTDFPGPKLDLHPSDFRPEEEPTEIPVDDPLTDPQFVVDLVKIIVDEPWDTEGWSILANERFMTVRAPRKVQAEVALALGMIASLK